VREFELRRREIELEMAKVIEQTLISLTSAKAELADVLSAEENATKAYNYAQEQFAQGKFSLTDLIIANELVIGTAMSRIGSRLKVDTHRVNLQRILIAGEFSRIPNCRLDKDLIRDKPFGWLRNIFSRDRNRVSVDELCRGR
jgi:outer membrane protein TolC